MSEGYRINAPEVLGRLVLNTNLLEMFIEERAASARESAADEIVDFASEKIEELAKEVKSWNCVGAYDEPFSVTILSWGGIYFVQALEFDDRGFFVDLAEAEAAALDIADAFPALDAED